MANNKNRHAQRGNNQQQNIAQIKQTDIVFSGAEGVDKRLFSDRAENIANILAQADKDKNSYTQLRRFYDEVNDFYEDIKSSVDKDDAYKTREPLIFMLNSKVAYAKGRNKVDGNFVNFIRFGLSQVNDFKSFETFKLLFEAVMGFLRAKKAK